MYIFNNSPFLLIVPGDNRCIMKLIVKSPILIFSLFCIIRIYGTQVCMLCEISKKFNYYVHVMM